MSTIDLHQVLQKIPDITDKQAKQAATTADVTKALHGIETELSKLREDSQKASQGNCP